MLQECLQATCRPQVWHAVSVHTVHVFWGKTIGDSMKTATGARDVHTLKCISCKGVRSFNHQCRPLRLNMGMKKNMAPWKTCTCCSTNRCLSTSMYSSKCVERFPNMPLEDPATGFASQHHGRGWPWRLGHSDSVRN